MLRKIAPWFVALAILFSCSRTSNFLSYVAPEKAPPVAKGSYKLKELTGNSQVDMLWVIDNSPSMDVYQAEVAANTGLFMKAFLKNSAINWKMGLISTDISDKPYIGFTGSPLTSGSADPVGDFKNAVSHLGTNGSGREQTFAPVIQAIQNDPTFLRPNAALVILSVTDAPEQSSMDSAEFYKNLLQAKKDPRLVMMYGAYATPSFGCHTDEGDWLYPGSPYEAIIKPSGGKAYSLCSTTFGKDLADLGSDIAKRVTTSKISLSQRPIPSSLRVLYKGTDLRGGTKEAGGVWYYDPELNAVVFHSLDFAPGDDESVEISYSIVP